MTGKNVIHMGLEQPNRKRKEILNSAITAIDALKNYEKLKKIKRQKSACKKELRVVIKEIREQVKEMRSMMPEFKLPKEEGPKSLVIKETMVEKQPDKKIPQKPKVKKEHFGKLERDLQSLKDKISRI